MMTIHAYLGCDGAEYIDKVKEVGDNQGHPFHAYLGCVGCDGVEYIDKDM